MYLIIEHLVEEHQKISDFLVEFEDHLIDFMENDTFKYEYFEKAVDFIRNFADGIHHQKEEDILFKYLLEHGGATAENIVRHGMLVEHDLGRFYVQEFYNALLGFKEKRNSKDKLNMLAYGQSYKHLLVRHIDKENNVLYPFASRILSKELFDEMAVLENQSK